MCVRAHVCIHAHMHTLEHFHFMLDLFLFSVSRNPQARVFISFGAKGGREIPFSLFSLEHDNDQRDIHGNSTPLSTNTELSQ